MWRPPMPIACEPYPRHQHPPGRAPWWHLENDHSPHEAGSAARPSGYQLLRPFLQPRLWALGQQTAASRCDSLSMTQTTQASPAHDLADRSDIETAVFDVAPAVDLSKYRTKPRIGNLQPVA